MRKLLNIANLPCKFQQIRGVSSATAGITKTHRLLYCRVYPTTLVQPDGSTITIRYHEPRQIIQLPLDLTTLTEEERKRRLESRKPQIVMKVEEDLEDNFSARKYLRYVKK
ncbi:39S ribosomal protein L55, mitochondrial [Sitodiplosis mosellana]|uniref:39S ribosomal protein L55, mitochondrial n=1 Tax=Sitodiplosis mosellana TaxID=263140 RepID=UPI0024441D59|nr:39S ribosomal protein L55, mitochondrial [Sitodiplosis mosellana]